MKQALIYHLTLTFHESNEVDQDVLKEIIDLKSEPECAYSSSCKSESGGKIIQLFFTFAFRENLMDFLRKLYTKSTVLNLRMVASKNKVRKANDFYFEVRISQEFVDNNVPSELQKKFWTDEYSFIYGYAIASYVYHGLASELELYYFLNHPLAKGKTINIRDSQGIDYTILEDSFLELW
ncbi:hypothetical protein SLH46_15185 [Draconibacterium sp. IB214405]|uniref:hypothetical protein n=1 Tax=Draconibacterium sp. IB214405 TaxID=3097352 RepID=UPI002A0EA2F8|nr:hypothetical protein [Draconibacterium sp. IB214405]MDX8340542.1 hypothetical protein [Draconibacterium sp. IB214405]